MLGGELMLAGQMAAARQAGGRIIRRDQYFSVSETE